MSPSRRWKEPRFRIGAGVAVIAALVGIAKWTAPDTSRPTFVTVPTTAAGSGAASPSTTAGPTAPAPSFALPDGTAPDPNERAGDNSADRVLFWIPVTNFVALTDADLRMWKERGVDGFVPQFQWLYGMGGGRTFTPDPAAPLDGEPAALQRSLRDSKIVARSKSMGMKVYAAFNLANTLNPRTPLAEWFDDNAWNTVVLPRVNEFAATMKMLGFDGLAFDQEMYAQENNVQTATWSPAYLGNTHTGPEVHAQATLRGRQMMTAILAGFPAVDIEAYATVFPTGWEALVQQEVNNIPMGEGTLHVSFWDGLTSVNGYKAIRFLDAVFYKTSHLHGSSWDTSNQYNANQLYALFSQRFSNWAYASSRTFVSPFAWIDGGISEFEAPNPPDEVAKQLLAFRTWSTGRELAVFAFNFAGFDYGPYVPGMQAASTPAVVDDEPPSISVAGVHDGGTGIEVTGTATDNLAIRAVRWSGGGQEGVARLTWKVDGGDFRSKYEWEMEWTMTVPAAAAADLVVTAEDIKGLTADQRVPERQ